MSLFTQYTVVYEHQFVHQIFSMQNISTYKLINSLPVASLTQSLFLIDFFVPLTHIHLPPLRPTCAP